MLKLGTSVFCFCSMTFLLDIVNKHWIIFIFSRKWLNLGQSFSYNSNAVTKPFELVTHRN